MDRHKRTSPYPSAPTSKFPASSAVSPNAYPDEDWRGIKDLAERRRIQNRIAQRIYRQKMKEKRLDNDGKRAHSLSPERSRQKLSDPADRVVPIMGQPPRRRSSTREGIIRPSRSTMTTPISSRRTSPLRSGMVLPSTSFSQELLSSHSPSVASSQNSPYAQAAFSTPYSSAPSITYTDFSRFPDVSGYYPNDPVTSSPPAFAPQYQEAASSPYLPYGEYPSYNVSHPTPAGLHTLQQPLYARLSPQTYPYTLTSNSLMSDEYEDTDSTAQDSKPPLFRRNV